MLDAQTGAYVTVEEVQIPVEGRRLIGLLYTPVCAPRGTMVINGATGVPQAYYQAFAYWVAEIRGMAVLTFDYRDFGASAIGPSHKAAATMSDWALLDQPAARREMKRRFPDLPLWVLGHSLGGLLMPMQDDLDKVDRMITLAAGRVHVSQHPMPFKLGAMMFWFGHGPLLTALCGYLPGHVGGMGPEDLPGPLYWQWRRWCTSREFYFDDPTVPAPSWPSDVPVDMVALTDDLICPPQCVTDLAPVYGGKARVITLNPKDCGLGYVGHLAAVSRRNAALWPQIVPELSDRWA